MNKQAFCKTRLFLEGQRQLYEQLVRWEALSEKMRLRKEEDYQEEWFQRRID